MSIWTQSEIENLIQKCQTKAAMDSGFRQNLLADPLGAAQSLADKEIPSGLKVKIIENDPAYDFTFVLNSLSKMVVEESDLENLYAGAAHCDSFHATEYCEVFHICGRDSGKR